MINTDGKKILDVTCGGRSIWFDKHHPDALYCDRRVFHEEKRFGSKNHLRTIDVSPDVVCDFTNLPFDSESFSLVVFDPPHLNKCGDECWMAKAYGKLKDGWQDMLHDGFRECMRVLKPDGVLIFKWAETDIPADELWAAIGTKPLFGHRSGKKSNTFWACFMKGCD